MRMQARSKHRRCNISSTRRRRLRKCSLHSSKSLGFESRESCWLRDKERWQPTSSARETPSGKTFVEEDLVGVREEWSAFHSDPDGVFLDRRSPATMSSPTESAVILIRETSMKYLHTMVRVTDLPSSLRFFC